MAATTKFACDYAKRGTAGCKKCKEKCEKGALRIAKVVPNFFHDGEGEMKQWHHPACLFQTFEKARATTKIIETSDEIDGFSALTDQDKEIVKGLITDVAAKRANKASPTKKAASKKKSPAAQGKSSTAAIKTEPKHTPTAASVKQEDGKAAEPAELAEVKHEGIISEDDHFHSYRKLCSKIAGHPSYNDKTNIVSTWLKKGVRGTQFDGDMYILIKLLLPGFVKRVYNINSKQLVKLFSQIFNTSLNEMNDHLDQGDVAETIATYFEESKKIRPQKHSTLSIQEIDRYLEQMSAVTKEDDQQTVLLGVTKRSTAEDLKMFVRLVKHDLRINAGAKHILEGLDSNAYEAFQASRNLRDVVDRVLSHKAGDGEKLSVKACLMTPVLPMLAEACKSVGYAMKKCPDGMYAEIKYDGERVQLHKKGDEFQYFSRSLKPVLPHKVSHFKDYIPKAFPGGQNLILDAEVLLVDTNTGNPLPFGTLGIHKKAAFSDAKVCLYIFDCLYYNDESLMNKPLKKRRQFLHKVMTEVPHRVVFSEQHDIKSPKQLNVLLEKVFREGLEGLVLKSQTSLYEPGKRHWLKVKKDYLADGAMADTADLVVLGAYFGTGNKGGMMSVFLMGCYDPASKCWCTVTKVHGGHDDATLAKLQTQLKMTKISKDTAKVPSWLLLNKGTATPDFIITDPKKSQVWEITGAEFSKSDIHTADGISIRFPRVTRIRHDKDWETATGLPRLKVLYEKSKETSTFTLGGDGSSPAKVKSSIPNNSMDSPVKSSKRKLATDKGSPAKKVKEEASSKSVDADSSTDFADIFLDMKFQISPGHDDYSKLKRYVIAYGGEMASGQEDADIIISSGKGKKMASTAWLFECVKQKSLVARY